MHYQKLNSFQFLGEPEKWINFGLRKSNFVIAPNFIRTARGLSQFGMVVAGAGLRQGKV
jgi:hypothetical protein